MVGGEIIRVTEYGMSVFYIIPENNFRVHRKYIN